MRVLLTGGGTGGHINPALAIAQCIQTHQPDVEILYAGTPKGMEARLVKQAGYDFAPIEVSGFHRSFGLADIKHNLRSMALLFSSNLRANAILKEFQPDVVIGTGGYVAGPVVLAAAKRGIKTMIHEQNAFPGVTNKILAGKVDVVLLAFKEAEIRMTVRGKCRVVGNPIRHSILQKTKEQARRELGMDDDFCIFSVGGSLGARVINQMAADLMQWNEGGRKCNHIHGFGGQGKRLFPEMLAERGVNLETCPRIHATEYIDNMDTCMMAADVVISRCGAITLSELEATGKASVLVPSPYVAENHQYHNAMVLVNHGAAKLIQETEYDRDTLITLIEELKNHPEQVEEMGRQVKDLCIPNTTELIYEELMTLLQNN